MKPRKSQQYCKSSIVSLESQQYCKTLIQSSFEDIIGSDLWKIRLMNQT